MKRIAALLLLFLAAFFAGLVMAQEKKADKPAEPKVEASKQPGEQWLKDYEDFVALQRSIMNLKAKYGIDKLENELNLQVQVLTAGVPAGYQFDQLTKKFVEAPRAAKK